MPGWGDAIGKIFDWLPGRRESKESEIQRLLKENEKIEKEKPLSSASVSRFERNADRIKQLRAEISRIK